RTRHISNLAPEATPVPADVRARQTRSVWACGFRFEIFETWPAGRAWLASWRATSSGRVVEGTEEAHQNGHPDHHPCWDYLHRLRQNCQDETAPTARLETPQPGLLLPRVLEAALRTPRDRAARGAAARPHDRRDDGGVHLGRFARGLPGDVEADNPSEQL